MSFQRQVNKNEGPSQIIEFFYPCRGRASNLYLQIDRDRKGQEPIFAFLLYNIMIYKLITYNGKRVVRFDLEGILISNRDML